jgi:hypothetical protein
MRGRASAAKTSFSSSSRGMEREEQPLPRIGPWQDALDQLLGAN